MRFEFSGADLAPVIEATVREVLKEIKDVEAALSDSQISYSEQAAGKLLGTTGRVIADARRANKLSGTKIGKHYVYSRTELLRFFESQKLSETQG